MAIGSIGSLSTAGSINAVWCVTASKSTNSESVFRPSRRNCFESARCNQRESNKLFSVYCLHNRQRAYLILAKVYIDCSHFRAVCLNRAEFGEFTSRSLAFGQFTRTSMIKIDGLCTRALCEFCAPIDERTSELCFGSSLSHVPPVPAPHLMPANVLCLFWLRGYK